MSRYMVYAYNLFFRTSVWTLRSTVLSVVGLVVNRKSWKARMIISIPVLWLDLTCIDALQESSGVRFMLTYGLFCF